MSGTLWAITLSIIYVVLLVTLGILTFRKGHWVLGLIGFLFPVLWLLGAVLPDPAAATDARRRVERFYGIRLSSPSSKGLAVPGITRERWARTPDRALAGARPRRRRPAAGR